jgi:hypothetical protein
MLPLLDLRRFLRSLTAGLCSLQLLLACGSRSDTEHYLYGDDGSGATSSGATTGSGATASGATTGSGANGSGANGTGANGTGANGTGANGAGADGGTGPIGVGGFGVGGTAVGGTGQGAAGSGSAGGPTGPRVSCGDTTCDASEQVCCAGLGGFGCIPQNQDCNGAVLSCSNSNDCSGDDVCCLRVIDEVGESSQCKANCQSMGMFRERQLCSTDAECRFDHCRETVFGVKVCTRR